MEVFIMTVASSLRFFFMFVFMCIFPWCVLLEAWRRLHVYNACLSWFFIMLLYGICSFSLSAVARHICPVFVILFKIYKYILYPMLSYRFIADTAIFLLYYKLYAFCSVQKRKIFYKKFPLTSTHAMLIKCLINICVLFSVYS